LESPFLYSVGVQVMKKKIACFFAVVQLSCLYACNDHFFIDTFNKHVPAAPWFNEELLDLCNKGMHEKQVKMVTSDCDRPLFNYFPGLKGNIPHVSCAQLPTPVEKLDELEKALDVGALYIKQDSKAGKQKDGTTLFGGNKVRKLEFLLADAIALGVKTVMTFGCAGSNHVLATCTYAQELGMDAIALLMPQPNKYAVQRNILLDAQTNAQLLHYPSKPLRTFGAMHTFMWHKVMHGDFPYVIPTGGSCPVGVLGFVNAACELKKQIDDGHMQMPDCIIVPSGSYGTVSGLLLGNELVGITSKVYSVSVEPEENAGEYRSLIKDLFEQTNELLYKADASIPMVPFPHDRLCIVNDFSGSGYGVDTQDAQKAVDLLKNTSNICLDTTYSGKGFACVIAYAQQGKFKDKTVLFWNTYSEYTQDMQTVVDAWKYKELPLPLQVYFNCL